MLPSYGAPSVWRRYSAIHEGLPRQNVNGATSEYYMTLYIFLFFFFSLVGAKNVYIDLLALIVSFLIVLFAVNTKRSNIDFTINVRMA